MLRFADNSTSTDADLAMDAEELLGYLRNMDYDSLYPMEAILAQTEAIGDPALPTTEQRAILNWLEAAMKDWDRHYPLEEPLATELRRLRPLVAALAITDSGFLTPGAHPLHQLLDAIQAYAVGWQAREGRVGGTLEQEIRSAVSGSLVWFDAPATNLSLISARVAASAARAATRTRKMTQRLVDAEHGRIRVAQSKQRAALMINAVLKKYPAPKEIGEFIKGPWYESAQLLLIKFGEKSPQWEDMSLTTTRLLKSLQNPLANGEDGVQERQRAFALAAQLPNELVQWLLSLQHDGEAVREAIGQIKFFHSQILRGRSLELEKIPPIALEIKAEGKPGSDKRMGRLKEGQWFKLNTDDDSFLRAMLVLKLEEEQQLLFANQAGIKVLVKSFSEFMQLMEEGRVTLLDTGASFSRCLARSAGVETQDDLDELTGVAAERARLKKEQSEKAERERRRLERKQAERERIELERRQREQQEIENARREMEEAQRLQLEYEQAQRLKQERAEQERLQLACEREEARQLQVKWERVSKQFFEGLQERRGQLERGFMGGTDKQADNPALNIPRCTWLGFRDGDDGEVVLARLAVYNREQNNYIFVDRYGIKVRQLRGKELLIIMTRGLMDILEARSRFREEVAQAQKADGSRT